MYKSRIPSLTVSEIRHARKSLREKIIHGQENSQSNYIFLTEPLTEHFSISEFTFQYTRAIIQFRRNKASRVSKK